MFPIFLIVFVDVLGFGITLPVLPLFAQYEFGATAPQVALLASTYFLAQFLAAPQLGRLSDRLGRRPVLIVSQAGTSAALFISGTAVALPFLFVARAIDGLTGGNISVAQAYLSDITDERNRAQGLGIVNAAFSSGFLFGPAFGAFVASIYGPRVPYYIAAGISLVTITLSFFLLPESLPPERRALRVARPGPGPESERPRRTLRVTSLLRLPGVTVLMAIAFGGQLAFFLFQSVWVLWAERVLFAGQELKFVQRAVGGIFTLVGLVGIMTQVWWVKPIVRRFGERTMVAGGLLVRGLAWGLMAGVPAIGLIILVAPLISFGGGLVVPGIMALLTYLVPQDERGYAIGLMESVQGLGRILGPVIAGQLFERLAPGAPLGLAALVSGMSVIASLALWRIPQARPVAREGSSPGESN